MDMPLTKTVADVMTRDVFTVYEEDNLNQLREKLARHSFHHLPVVDGTRLVGMLSQRDVLRATVSGVDQGAFAQARESRFLERTFVRDVMCTPVLTARPHEPLSVVAQRMLEHRIGALPVIEDEGRLVGIITENDLLRVVALLA
jgi:acetoin utilization protein AcuB